MTKIRLAGTVGDSITDGPGIRYTIFVQGCPHNCPGCHNPQTHDFGGGKDVDIDVLLEEGMRNPLLCGVTFSGGEPMCQARALAELARKLSERPCLAHRLSAAERHSAKQGVAHPLFEQDVYVHVLAAAEIVRLRIVTAGAVVRTALHEYRISDARPVGDRVADGPGKTYLCHYLSPSRPCLTRSFSSARFALLKRSSVPTR